MSTYICETPGCSRKDILHDNHFCYECKKPSTMIRLKRLDIGDTGKKLKPDEYEKV